MTRILTAERNALASWRDVLATGFLTGFLAPMCLLSAPVPAMCRCPVPRNPIRTTRFDST